MNWKSCKSSRLKCIPLALLDFLTAALGLFIVHSPDEQFPALFRIERGGARDPSVPYAVTFWRLVIGRPPKSQTVSFSLLRTEPDPPNGVIGLFTASYISLYQDHKQLSTALIS